MRQKVQSLLDAAHDLGERLLIYHQVVTPMVHATGRDGSRPVFDVMDIKNCNERRMALAMAFCGYDVVRFAVFAKAWQPAEQPTEPSGLRPAQTERREDLLEITAGDEVGTWMTTAPIVRSDDGLVSGVGACRPIIRGCDGWAMTLLPQPPVGSAFRSALRAAFAAMPGVRPVDFYVTDQDRRPAHRNKFRAMG